MVNLSVLDVGHGNCAILRDANGTVVLDGGGNRQTLLRYLRDHELTVVDEVFISHADADHIGGLIELLLNPPFIVRTVRVNPDVTKHTQIWKQLRSALNFKPGNDKPKVFPLIAQPLPDFERGTVRLEVLAPTSERWLDQYAGETKDATKISSNAMSSVVRVVVNDVGKVLLTGDMDASTLNSLLERSADLRAQVLIFPHHGGLPHGADATSFAMQLCRAVEPEMVIFSIDRYKHQNPRPEVIAGVKEGSPDAHIACTQLSARCTKHLPTVSPLHLGSIHAQGIPNNSCCAGTIQFDLDTHVITSIPTITQHRQFVNIVAPEALCKVIPEMERIEKPLLPLPRQSG